ncbi:restriction endonuclease [Desulfobotulus sp.]|jgi:hypothetical protein|uniref:restriction endonuclease n=1 Tax=Desulfobotulus sp. TaxID=1940337 RepID=UPI002A36F681|nr:restriction endonuclease [Desulfobotulus sp.]MDY0164223.1 restriction endonuclease [Desulfobotulus sp.]
MDVKKLNWEAFETLVARLLSASGNVILEQSRYGVSGPDLVLRSPSGNNILVEVKHFKRQVTLPAAIVRKITHDLERYSKLENVDHLLLVTSNELSKGALEEISKYKNVKVLGPSWILESLRKNPKIEREFSSLIDAIDQIEAPINDDKESPSENSLISELKKLPPGKGHWREYEDLCVKILNYLFLNPLAPPKIQNRTEDGLDIRDAIYPIRLGNPHWDTLRNECRSRFMVAEFKNYTDPPGQREVESIQQYLYPKAMRSFGVLCSRQPVSEPAHKQRRRAWVESEKLIVMLCDIDLIEMIQLKDSGEEPFEVIDAQLEEFFSVLCA